ncbi:hypothetical protein Taro_034330 [Colocasia esculenta]|uniref:Uncharacterized protein n=1 Tax=Colocasia esculenta TaxID=4460 RepID=A0A843WF68_COLES|nr:hypothetical protein [Colocasia esculenta]
MPGRTAHCSLLENLTAVSGRSRSGRPDRWTHTRDLGVKDIDAKFLSVQKHRPNSKNQEEWGSKNHKTLLDIYMDDRVSYLPLKNTPKGSKMAVKLSLGSPKKPPKTPPSGFLTDVDTKARLGKPSLML